MQNSLHFWAGWACSCPGLILFIGEYNQIESHSPIAKNIPTNNTRLEYIYNILDYNSVEKSRIITLSQ